MFQLLKVIAGAADVAHTTSRPPNWSTAEYVMRDVSAGARLQMSPETTVFSICGYGAFKMKSA